MATTILSTALRNQLTRLDPSLVVKLKNVRVNGRLMGCSGFVRKGDHVVYVSTDNNHGTVRQALLRVARDERDFTGGRNRFTEYDELAAEVAALLRRLANGHKEN